ATANVAGRLDWVGMRNIEVPINLAVEGGVAPQASARVTAYVNLTNPDARGIHMSRLYLLVDQWLTNEPLTPSSLGGLVSEFMRSHEDLSDGAFVRVDFDYLVRRPALKSSHSGWRHYPVYVAATHRGGKIRFEVGCEVVYSSTCPCSAALARQLIQQQFEKDFGSAEELDYDEIVEWLGSERGICATPHSQRSKAEVRIVVGDDFDMFPVLDVIDHVEGVLGTPVQTAVKREDEQAFARVNGENLMFCEDAARRIKQGLEEEPRYRDFWIRASHLESLHPHDAVAEACKGVPGGFTA
ncbi:MAG: GTP cyclohydrolase FolE2, partial [Xanthomonadales bacterium]|nr:GTP cyclohydrolase FolE2 [Xanthomonadales bacterium]